MWLGDVAQLGERRLCKPEVVGSSPIVSIFSLLNAKKYLEPARLSELAEGHYFNV